MSSMRLLNYLSSNVVCKVVVITIPPPHVLGNQENILLQILRLVSLLSLSHLYEKILARDVKEQK